VCTSPSILRSILTTAGVPDGTPKDTPVTRTTWLTESVDRGLCHAFRRNMCDTEIGHLIQWSMVPCYVVLEYENSPWVVVEPDKGFTIENISCGIATTFSHLPNISLTTARMNCVQ
jgi:hypothetical protein